MSQKLGSNRCPLFTMLTKQKFLNVLHSKLVKKTKGLPGLLSDPLSQGLHFSKESGLIILGDLPILKKISLFSRATCPHTHISLFSPSTSLHILIVVYFQGWQPIHTHTGLFSHIYSHWSIFTGDLPNHTHCGLFLRTTYPRTLTLVYFHERPAHIYSCWSIFTGDLPTHAYFGLFLGATYPHILIVAYFHRRLAHTYSHWSIFTGDLPFWLG
jgi:hypothetical protein